MNTFRCFFAVFINIFCYLIKDDEENIKLSCSSSNNMKCLWHHSAKVATNNRYSKLKQQVSSSLNNIFTSLCVNVFEKLRPELYNMFIFLYLSFYSTRKYGQIRRKKLLLRLTESFYIYYSFLNLINVKNCTMFTLNKSLTIFLINLSQLETAINISMNILSWKRTQSVRSKTNEKKLYPIIRYHLGHRFETIYVGADNTIRSQNHLKMLIFQKNFDFFV